MHGETSECTVLSCFLCIVRRVSASFELEMSVNNSKGLLYIELKCLRETTGLLTTFKSATQPRWKETEEEETLSVRTV